MCRLPTLPLVLLTCNFFVGGSLPSAILKGHLHLFQDLVHWAKREENILNLAEKIIERKQKELNNFFGYLSDTKLSGTFVASFGLQIYSQLLKKKNQLMKIRKNLSQTIDLNETEIYYDHKDWPNLKDLNNTMTAFRKTQIVLDIPLSNFSTVLAGGQEVVDFKASQIAEIGIHALDEGHFDFAVEWLEWSRRRVLGGDVSMSFHDVDALFNLTVKLHNDAFQDISQDYSNLFDKEISPGQSERRKTRNVYYEDTLGKTDLFATHANYWALCAGKKLQTEEELSHLFCYYEQKIHKVWLIGPLKVEQLAPGVVQIYDLLGEQQMARVLAVVPKDEKSEEDNVEEELLRVEPLTDLVPELSRKVQQLSGLDGSGRHASDPFRLFDYLPGFIYRSHGPHKDASAVKYPGYGGDVLLTALFYFNEVEVGGQTAFCSKRTLAPTIKGSAVVWLNLFRNGTVMPDVWHSSCPIVYGYKTAAVKFLRYSAQFQTYQCSLNHEE